MNQRRNHIKRESSPSAPLQQSYTPPTQRDQPKLTKKDMLILIKHYRGSSDGLEGLPEKDLAILLCSYQVCVTTRKLVTVLT